jgi:hypothetical protein
MYFYMNTFLKFFLVIAGIIIIFLLVITVSRVLNRDQATPTQPVETNLAVDMVQQAITTVPEQTFVSGQTVIRVENFMNNGKTFDDPMNPTNYILSGDLGYCLEDGFCLNNSDSSNYEIWFNGKDGVFYIRLLEQPIRAARLDAEQFLQRTLNLSAMQLCSLDYYMSVSEYTDVRYVGQHLQFSSCVGSQKL